MRRVPTVSVSATAAAKSCGAASNGCPRSATLATSWGKLSTWPTHGPSMHAATSRRQRLNQRRSGDGTS
eukprot:465608-Prymnesium_polylepis.1